MCDECRPRAGRVAMTNGELLSLAASVGGVDREEIVAVVIVVGTESGVMLLGSESVEEDFAMIDLLAKAIERSALQGAAEKGLVP